MAHKHTGPSNDFTQTTHKIIEVEIENENKTRNHNPIIQFIKKRKKPNKKISYMYEFNATTKKTKPTNIHQINLVHMCVAITIFSR